MRPRRCATARATEAASLVFVAGSPAVRDVKTSGQAGRWEHTFSYIVSLPVSEKVSGVAILASNLEKVGKIR